MDTAHDNRYIPLAKSICDLVGPGRGVGLSGKAYKDYILIEINGLYKLIGDGYLDILRCMRQSYRDCGGVRLCLQRKEAFLQKRDICRIRGVIRIDQFNSHTLLLFLFAKPLYRP